jgi:hypothetical protein
MAKEVLVTKEVIISKEECQNQEKNLKPKSIIKLISEINSEFLTLSELILDTGYTGIQDNYKIRQRLNNIVHELRKSQDLVIKIRSSNKVSDGKKKKLVPSEQN